MKSLEDLEKKINSELTTKINKTEIKHNHIYLETDKDDLIDIKLKIFPNPTKGLVTVATDLPIIQINLYAADGKLLSVNKHTEIDIYNKGIYFLKVISEKGSVIKKLIVE